MPNPLDETDRALLEDIQRFVPLDHRPFEILAEKLGILEQDYVARLARLKEQQVIRRISGVFDAAALGYQSALVAMRLSPSRVDEAAEIVCRHPGVSSCQQRNDVFNLWFAIALPPSDSLEQIVQILEALVKPDETILLPTLHIYKIGPDAELVAQELLLESQPLQDTQRRLSPRPVLSERDIRLIRLLQEDLPLLELPFAVWAEQAETTEDELFGWAKKMEHLGYLRRFSAVTAPRQPGFPASATVVWQVPKEQVEAIGERISLIREVGYCCRRPVSPSWPYALFTLIHAETDAGCMESVRRIEEHAGQFPHKHLFSMKEYKRARLLYFDPALDTWWKDIGSQVEVAR